MHLMCPFYSYFSLFHLVPLLVPLLAGNCESGAFAPLDIALHWQLASSITRINVFPAESFGGGSAQPANHLAYCWNLT